VEATMTAIRVASHVHSDWSYDGSWSLPQLAAAFAQRGYDAVLMAEHDRGFDETRWSDYRQACAKASTATTVLVPGIEYSDPTDSVHVPVWGDIPFLGQGLDTAVLLPLAKHAGGLAVLAHPGRRNVLGQLDPALFSLLTGIELWNRKYDGYAPNHAAAGLLRQRPELMPVVGLDFHTARQFHPLAMVLETGGSASEAAIFEALRRRRAHPKAFGLNALNLARGPAWPAMRCLEHSRKGVAGRVRDLRRLRARGRS